MSQKRFKLLIPGVLAAGVVGALLWTVAVAPQRNETATAATSTAAATSAAAKSKTVVLPKTPVQIPKDRQVATFAAGCFWSMEAIFKQLKGVDSVTPGYAGGRVVNPSYEKVETATTGHAEAIRLVFDPKVISYSDLLDVLLTVRNPTTLNKQGPDEGPQYRSVIFYHNEEQRKAANEAIRKTGASRIWKGRIVTPVEPFSNFYTAEKYHFDYYNQHPDEGYCSGVIAPEIKEFREKFKSKLKS